jgi:cytochrome bd ubiquinol oxidase subunit II
MDLKIVWYLVICASAIAYIVLDGFDLGVGMLHLWTKKDEERRLMLNAIGPVWDGNEVWIVVVGGALLAGFPAAYATLCSVFYTPLMIFLAGIIFRAVAIEFRSKLPHPSWRTCWDVMFSIGSFIIALVLGVLLGNLVTGVPLDQEGSCFCSFWSFFTPYTLLTGVTGVALFLMHGAIYLNMKTEGDLHAKTRIWSVRTMIFFIITYIALTLVTLIQMHHMHIKMQGREYLYFIGVLALFCIATIPYLLHKRKDGLAFICSCFSIALLFALFGLGVYPDLIRSTADPANSITVYNSASSPLTLSVLLIITAIGLPLVFAYGFWIYRIFRGKVKLGTSSY